MSFHSLLTLALCALLLFVSGPADAGLTPTCLSPLQQSRLVKAYRANSERSVRNPLLSHCYDASLWSIKAAASSVVQKPSCITVQTLVRSLNRCSMSSGSFSGSGLDSAMKQAMEATHDTLAKSETSRLATFRIRKRKCRGDHICCTQSPTDPNSNFMEMCWKLYCTNANICHL